jgi:hypothetical protein
VRVRSDTILRSGLIAIIAAVAIAAAVDILVQPVKSSPNLGLGPLESDRDLAARLELRLAPLRAVLPTRGVVGYLTEQPISSSRMQPYSEQRFAVYALAPLVVDRAPEHPVVIANFESEAALRRFLDSHDEWAVTADLGRGLAVLARLPP